MTVVQHLLTDDAGDPTTGYVTARLVGAGFRPDTQSQVITAVDVRVGTSGRWERDLLPTGPGEFYRVTVQPDDGLTRVLEISVPESATPLWLGDLLLAAPLPAGSPLTGYLRGLPGPAGAGFTPRGPWTEATAYAERDVVTNGGSTFLVTTAHTSSAPAPTAAAPGAAYVVWAARGDVGPAAAGATDATRGTVRLAGDLGGTADSPTVPGLADKVTATQVSDAILARELARAASGAVVEGTSVYAYGHSYLAADFNSINSGQRYINRLSGRLRFGSLTNRAVAGYRMSDVALDAQGTRDATKTWTVGAQGIPIVDGTTNDVIQNGGGAQAQRGYTNSLRALLWTLSLGSRVEESAWTHTASMVSSSLVDATGGTLRVLQSGGTGQTGSSTTTFTGTRCVVGAFGLASTTGGQFEVVVDGTVRATYDVDAQGVASSVSGVSRLWVPLAIPITGLTNASHTVVVRPLGNVAATGEGPFLDYLGIPSATPPAIVLVKMVKLTAAGYAANPGGASDATVDLYNGLLIAVAAEFPHVVVVDPTVGWDPATMIGADGVHPNARGMAHIAAAVEMVLRLLAYAPGSTH